MGPTMVDNPTENGAPQGTEEPFTFNEAGEFVLPDGTKIGSLQELGEGYLRQADYTRKTQDLALQRQEVETAAALMDQLQVDPAGTLKRLATNLGVDLAPPAAPNPRQQSADDWGGDWDDDTPSSTPSQDDPRITQLFEAVNALKGSVQQLAGNQARVTVDSELGRVREKYSDLGIQIDDAMLLRYAQAKAIGDLDIAAQALYSDDIVAARVAAAQKEQHVVDEKRSAGQAVEPGSGPVVTTPPSNDGDVKLDLRQSIEAALSEHGVTDLRQIEFDSPVVATY